MKKLLASLKLMLIMIINDGRHIPRVEKIDPKKPARL